MGTGGKSGGLSIIFTSYFISDKTTDSTSQITPQTRTHKDEIQITLCYGTHLHISGVCDREVRDKYTDVASSAVLPRPICDAGLGGDQSHALLLTTRLAS